MQFVSSLNINFSWQVDAILLPLIFFLLPSRVLYRSSLRNQNILQSQRNHSQPNYLIVKSIQESQLHRGRFASWSEIGDKLSSKSRD